MKRKFKIIFRSQEVEKDVTPSVVSVEQGRKPNPQRIKVLCEQTRELTLDFLDYV